MRIFFESYGPSPVQVRIPVPRQEFYSAAVIEYEDISRRLAAIGKNRQWLAKQLKLSDNTVRQYLGPKGKRTREFMEEIDRVITLEAARQRELQPDAPPWNVIFQTAEECDRADRASRAVHSESLIEFCRSVILERADEILSHKARSGYPKSLPSAKVAEPHPTAKPAPRGSA